MNAAARLRRQERSRRALRRAVRDYALMRGGTGTHTDTVEAQLRDGTPVTALITVELVPSPTA